MFSRSLRPDELEIIDKVEAFVRDKHKESDSHDYSHILEVTQYAVKISEKLADPVEPFTVICGALLHDIGKTNNLFSSMHGILGSALAEEFLDALGYSFPQLRHMREAICRIVARHTPTTMVPPETIEEKIVFDADCLDRLGVIGVLRGFIGKKGDIQSILESKMVTREQDFHLLHFEESRQLGKQLNKETMEFISIVRKDLKKRKNSIKELYLGVNHST